MFEFFIIRYWLVQVVGCQIFCVVNKLLLPFTNQQFAS